MLLISRVTKVTTLMFYIFYPITSQVYRHSFLADYHIYDVDQQWVVDHNYQYYFCITRTVGELSSPIEGARIQYAAWSPSTSVPQIVRILQGVLKYVVCSVLLQVIRYSFTILDQLFL